MISKQKYSITFARDKQSLAYKDMKEISKYNNSMKSKKKSKPNVSMRVKETAPRQLGSEQLEHYLISKGIYFIKEKVFKGMNSTRNAPLRIDFYIPELLLALEYDGYQHYTYTKMFHKDISDFKRAVKNDRIKDLFCHTKGIELVRIKYKDLKNLDKKLGIYLEP